MLALYSMKQIKFLFIAIIGMMITTVTANTTAKLEKKQKIESVSYQTDFLVVNDHVFVEVVQTAQADVLPTKSDNDYKVVSVILKDVGWPSSGAKFTQIHYKEKLLENQNVS